MKIYGTSITTYGNSKKIKENIGNHGGSTKLHEIRWHRDENPRKVQEPLGKPENFQYSVNSVTIVVLISMEIARTETSQHTRGTPVFLVLHRIG